MTRPDATKEFVISDHLGSVRAIFNEQGQTVQRLDYESYGKELVSEGTGARTSFIGRERDGESDLGFFVVRLYDQQYGRFLSTDKMWEKYAAWQPYQYAVNSPIFLLDPGGETVVATQPDAQAALSGALNEHFGVMPTYSANGVLAISLAQAESAKSNLSGEDLIEFNGIMDMIGNTEKLVNVFTLSGVDSRVPNIRLLTDDGSLVTQKMDIGEVDPEYFVSRSGAPSNAAIVFRPEVAATATFTAANDTKTAPCGSCVLMHSLVDHALPWAKFGTSATRYEGVKGHNSALKRKGETVLRDGTDHTNNGSQK